MDFKEVKNLVEKGESNLHFYIPTAGSAYVRVQGVKHKILGADRGEVMDYLQEIEG